MTAEHRVRVAANQAGDRLDKVLARHLPQLSRARLQALLAEGRVSDGSGATLREAKRKVRAGEEFIVRVPPPAPARPRPQAMDLDVVYEDADLIVIDKPQGLVVHPAAGHAEGTLVNGLIAHCGDSLSGIGGETRPGIVHRLDKDTSGLLVAAKNDTAHRSLSRQFHDHTVDRAYRALVWGVPRPAAGEIVGNIGRDPKNRKKMAVVARGGKPARTAYRVIGAAGDQAALVECRLATGRTHQIRVHMASLGHPVMGDPLYAGRRGRLARAMARLGQEIDLPKTQLLHAYILGFDHPSTGERCSFESKKLNKINNLYESLRSLYDFSILD